MSEQANLIEAMIYELNNIKEIELLMQTLNERRALIKKREQLAKKLGL